jgi:hypothetical protein
MILSPDPQFTPEQEVLLWAIRVDHTKDQRVAEILVSGVEWGYVRKTAIQHGIIPLLYKRLKGEMADLVHSDELSTLRTLFMENAVKNIQMTQNLLKVLDLLADSGVEAMPFKGPALAVQAYGDLSMRSFCDLDILIHANDLSRVSQILTDQRYILNDPAQTNIERILKIINKKDLSFSFHDNLLELHWKIIERFYAVPLDMDQIWERSLPIFINSQKIKTLSPEDMIIVLCFHGLKHTWLNLNWYADLIYTISNHPDIKWHNVFVRAEKMGLKRIVLIGLLMAQRHGGIKYEIEIESLFASDIPIRKLAEKFPLNLFQVQYLESSFIKPFFYLQSRERFKDQIMFLLYFFTVRVLLLPHRTMQQIKRIRTSPDKGLG